MTLTATPSLVPPRPAVPLVSLVRGARRHVRVRRRLLGHLVAPLDRPRLVLEPAAHGDLRLRRARRTVVGVSHLHDDVRTRARRCARRACASGDCADRSAPSSRPGAALAMLVSAPFDDWWHNAYGLDVRIISPPHMVLAAGFFGINFGTMMLMLAFVNRAGDAARRASAAAVAVRRRHGRVRVAAPQARVHQPCRDAPRVLLRRGAVRHARRS